MRKSDHAQIGMGMLDYLQGTKQRFACLTEIAIYEASERMLFMGFDQNSLEDVSMRKNQRIGERDNASESD